MKTVWFVQDYNSMAIDCVYTTKKAAFVDAKKYGKGRFKTIIKNEIYYYFTINNKNDPICLVQKVPVIKAKKRLAKSGC